MSSEKVIKEKNKILFNEDEDYDNDYDSEFEFEENKEREDEYYQETINNSYKYLLNYADTNNLTLCEFLDVNDIKKFLEKFIYI